MDTTETCPGCLSPGPHEVVRQAEPNDDGHHHVASCDSCGSTFGIPESSVVGDDDQ
jgi:hypothetical protein